MVYLRFPYLLFTWFFEKGSRGDQRKRWRSCQGECNIEQVRQGLLSSTGPYHVNNFELSKLFNWLINEIILFSDSDRHFPN